MIVRLTLIAFLWLVATFAFAQKKPAPVYIAPDAPAWMRMMQAENPDVFAIQKAWRDYHAERPFEKNTYTQYYKRWMHWARTRTGADGRLVQSLDIENWSLEFEHLENDQFSMPQDQGTSDKAAGWSWVGPSQTYHTDGTTKVTWQTNIYAFDIAPSNPNVLYAGGETGGVWKTTDKGQNWTLLTRNILHGSFGAVKIHPGDPNTVFAATGGKIIKTTDGGSTWTNAYTETNLWVNELAISPANPNIILAAADQGLLVSTNGGASWSKKFTNQTWAVKFKPGDPTTAFAVRKNGNGSNFMQSTDSGATWSPSGAGWWTPGSGQAVTGAHIAVCPSNPDKLYAYLCGSGATLYGYIGVFVSNDAGATWANTHPTNAVGEPYSIPAHSNLMAHNGTTGFDQGFYDMAIIVNPANDQQLIAGGTSWFKSTDGGATWQPLGGYVGGLPWSHPDIQALAAHGSDLWIASDGGLNYSGNFGQTHEARMNGISGSDMWGFDSGWNDDLLVGGRYHNGNMAWHESFPPNSYYRMGGAEAPTGYVSPGPGLKTYHSDIGGYSLNGGLAGDVAYFPVGLFPNESYAYYANSEMVWHPQCWGIVFLGKDEKIWKSTDGGASFTVLHTFPGTADNAVYDIEIARSNPQVMYCTQWDGTDDAVWRSTDGGQTWSLCTPLPLPNNNDRVKLAVGAENADVLWCAVTYGSNGRKIYKSTDGGQSWINLTTTLLNGVRITNLMAQYGTDGGIYLGTDRGVFYRNNSHADWQPYSEGLPLSAETNRLKPFYRDGKIRNGCWGFGVWEAPLFEPSAVLPQAMADKLDSGCARDTFFFDDYSVVNHAGASWTWVFPGATFVSGENTRTPKAVFGKPGEYTAQMTLQTPQGIFRDTLLLRVGNGCDRDSFPGMALQLDGSGDNAVATDPLRLNSDTVTITTWIKRLGAQDGRAGIVFCRSSNTTAGIGFDGDRLSYHWNDAGWWWNSSLTVPQNEWVHVALVVEPTRVTMYLNGRPAVDNSARGPEEFDGPLTIGEDPNGGGRFFNGLVDEVCVYRRALSQAEIREQMHLVKLDPNDASLRAYYQFNEPGGQVLDRSGTRHLGLNGGAKRTASTLAVGPGFSARRNLTAPGTYYFGENVGFECSTAQAGVQPGGEVCATRINLSPDAAPDADPLSRGYWVVRNYGPNAMFAPLREMRFYRIGRVPLTTSASEYKLWSRPAHGEGNTWQQEDSGDHRKFGSNGSVIFSDGLPVDVFGQFVVSKPVPNFQQAPVEDRETKPAQGIRHQVYPNPVAADGLLHVQFDQPGTAVFRLFDEKGRAILVEKFEGQTQVRLNGLSAGVYAYSIEGGVAMVFDRVVVK